MADTRDSKPCNASLNALQDSLAPPRSPNPLRAAPKISPPGRKRTRQAQVRQAPRTYAKRTQLARSAFGPLGRQRVLRGVQEGIAGLRITEFWQALGRFSRGPQHMQPLDIPSHRHQRPLAARLVQPAHAHLAPTHHPLDDAEHGLDKARGEWSLVTMAWNILRLHVLRAA